MWGLYGGELMLMMSRKLLIRHLEESVHLAIISSTLTYTRFFLHQAWCPLYGRCSISIWWMCEWMRDWMNESGIAWFLWLNGIPKGPGMLLPLLLLGVAFPPPGSSPACLDSLPAPSPSPISIQGVAGQVVTRTVHLGSATDGVRFYSFRIEPYLGKLGVKSVFQGLHAPCMILI